MVLRKKPIRIFIQRFVRMLRLRSARTELTHNVCVEPVRPERSELCERSRMGANRYFPYRLKVQKTVYNTLLLAALSVGFFTPTANAMLFDQEPSTEDVTQLTTALLSIPTDIAAHAYADSNALACLAHSIKAVNEFLALSYQQEISHNTAWLCYDIAQSLRHLALLIKNHRPAKAKKADKEKVEQPSQETQEKTDADSAQPANQTSFTITPEAQKKIGIVLTSIEGLLRSWVALMNKTNEPATDATITWNKRELLHSLISLTRLGNELLYSSGGKMQALIITLLLANVVSALWQANTWYQNLPTATTPKRPRPMSINQKLHIEKACNQRSEAIDAAPPQFNHDAFYHCCEAYAEECTQNNALTSFTAQTFKDNFDQYCKDQHIAPFFKQNSKNLKRHNQYFQEFWQLNTGTNPFYGDNSKNKAPWQNVQSIKEFCDAYKLFYVQQITANNQTLARLKPVKFEQSEKECDICNESLQQSDVIICKNCNKEIHYECIIDWFINTTKKVCPLCTCPITE